MTHPLTDALLSTIVPREEGPDRFVAPAPDPGWGRLFGGQVLGQSLYAASLTVEAGMRAHALHAQFLLPGAVNRDSVLEVERTRDGASFVARRVVVRQEAVIFTAQVSFQREQEGPEHQDADPPAVTPPEALVNDTDLAQIWAARLPEPLRSRATAERAIEMRLVDPIDPLHPHRSPPRRAAWYRVRGGLTEDPRVHQALLLYASDFHFLGTALQPHGLSWLTPGVSMASLDHAMWFHRPFRFDDWLLFDMHGLTAGGGRALVLGRLFDRAGRLVASVTQEGMLRAR